MHFAGVCTEPDPRQAAAMSNFGISPSAADTICGPRMLTHTESRIVRFMGHSRIACFNVSGLGPNKQSVTSPLSTLTKIKNVHSGSLADKQSRAKTHLCQLDDFLSGIRCVPQNPISTPGTIMSRTLAADIRRSFTGRGEGVIRHGSHGIYCSDVTLRPKSTDDAGRRS